MKILSKHKRLFFACKKIQYQSWNITELQNWLSSARRILHKYRERIVDPTHLSHSKNLPSKHIMNRPPNHNHYKVFPITKYYPKHNPHMIPTSIDQARQKDNTIPTPSTTTVPHTPSVGNTSPNLPSNSSSPRTTSLNQSTNDYFPSTSNPLDHLPTHFRFKLINSSLPTSTLQKNYRSLIRY